MSIYYRLKQTGCKLDHHESDLYAEVTEETQKIIDGYNHKSSVKKFHSQIDGKLWFDIPFAFDPFWEKVEKISKLREGINEK